MRTSTRSFTAAMVVLLILAGCANSVPASGAATVDGTEIPRSQLEEAVTEITDRTGAIDGADTDGRTAVVGQLQRQLLSLMIQARIIEGLAAERDLELDDQQIADRLEGDVASVGDEDEFAQTLADAQLTVALYRDVLLPAQQRVEGLRGTLMAELPETEVRTARHILVDEEQEAQEIVELLADGEDFAELARERSADAGSGARGGDLGPAPRGSYVDGFEQAVWESEIGVVVGPVESDFGYHVVEVTDESVTSGEDLDPQTQTQALDSLLTEVLQDAFGASDVQVDQAFGTWDGDVGEVVESAGVGSDG